MALSPEVAASPVLDRLAVRYLVLDDEAAPWPAGGDATVADDGEAGTVYENVTVLPRIRWAGRAEVVPDPTARVDRLATGEVPDDTVVLSDAPPADGSGDPADLEVVRDGGDTIEVVVDAGGAGWLVVADSLGDWSATVDGDPAPIVAADHALGAVRVDRGTHRVVLSYTPDGWDTGLWVSGGALLALLGMAAAGPAQSSTTWSRKPSRTRAQRAWSIDPSSRTLAAASWPMSRAWWVLSGTNRPWRPKVSRPGWSPDPRLDAVEVLLVLAGVDRVDARQAADLDVAQSRPGEAQRAPAST